jgi:hypothetical protein
MNQIESPPKTAAFKLHVNKTKLVELNSSAKDAPIEFRTFLCPPVTFINH